MLANILIDIIIHVFTLFIKSKSLLNLTVLFCKERSAENKGNDFPLRKVNKRKSLNKTECARTLWRIAHKY